MASFILYSTLKPKAGERADYQRIRIGKTLVFIRAERSRRGVVGALDVADPRSNEIVLNTIPAA